MDDVQYDFISRNRELKSAATGAFHRKSGSKSTFCGLPSDHLTASQLKKLSGPVVSLNLNAPMKWAAFKELKTEHQILYLSHLRERFSASDAMLGEMFGVSQCVVSRKRSELGVAPFDAHQRANRKRMFEWRQFYGGHTDDSASEEAPVAAPLLNTTEEEADAASPDARPAGSVRLDGMRASFVVSGVQTVSDLESYLALLPLQEGAPATVRIELER